MREDDMATPVRIDINLTPAEFLYFNKLALRTRDGFPASAIPLPSVVWEADTARMSKNPRELIKMLMRYFAGTAAASGRRLGHDYGFVVLVSVTITPNDYSVTAYCPRADILDPLKRPRGLEQFGRDPAYAVPDILFKAAFPDTLCPVVVLWRHATRDVLITNEQHLKNPEYFLAIDLVNTTSGFLNFIGVLKLLDYAYTSERAVAPHFARIPTMMREAIHARSDEWMRWLAHLMDKQMLFSEKHIFVDATNPERYYYNYSGRLR
jgi:hypothetical protein